MSFVFTPQRRATSLKNLEKARESLRLHGRRDPIAPRALKHGLYAKDLRRSVTRVGEDLQEFDEHLRRLERAFQPQDAIEGTLLRVLGETAWRMLRAYSAGRFSAARKLRNALRAADPAETRKPTGTLALAVAVFDACADFHTVVVRATVMLSQIERLLHLLVRKRSGGELGFKISAHHFKRDWERILKLVQAEMGERRITSESCPRNTGPAAEPVRPEA